MKLLVRSNPFQGESLSGYFQRIANLNYVNLYDLWRLLISKNSREPKSLISIALDIFPDKFIDLNKLASMLDIDEDSLESLTFIPIYQKIGISKSAIHHSRVLSNIIEKHRNICPECLKENSIYKLIWQVQELNFCPRHNTLLQSNCHQDGV